MSKLDSSHITIFFLGTLVGTAAVSIYYSYIKKPQPITIEGDDDFLSLFWHKNLPDDGSGITETKTLSDEEISKLTVIKPEFKFLDKTFVLSNNIFDLNFI